MHRQVGDLVFDEEGLALRGLLVRHLLMPHGVADARRIFGYLAWQVSPRTYVHLMASYHPGPRVLEAPERYPDLARGVERREYEEAVAAARRAGLDRLDRTELRPGGPV